MNIEYLPYVLLVESDPDFRAILGKFLAEVGYNVVTASSVSEALDYYNKERATIGLVVADICTPEQEDGINLIRHIHQGNRALPIVAIGGNISPQLTRELAKMDIGFFHKPFDFEALYRFIERRAQRRLQEPRRVINMIRRESGFSNSALPAFLCNMSNVPDAAKDRCVIAITGLSHMNYLARSRHSLLRKRGTTFLNLCTRDRHMINMINRDEWTDPVIMVGSLYSLAYDHDIERLGKIAFFGGAALLPSDHHARLTLESKLYRENNVIENRLKKKSVKENRVGGIGMGGNWGLRAA